MDAAANPWTLEELTRRVAEATHRLGLLQENGQVADVPNARAIRWYTSTGLLRRPQQRGRVAFYGPAHLRELVAIKRLQAQGLTLDQVQQQLLGKSDDEVCALAGVPADVEAVAAAVVEGGGRSFWSDDVADAAVAGAVEVTGDAGAGDVVVGAARAAFDHPCGVTVVLPATARTPTADDVQAILSAVVSTLTARGLLAVGAAAAEPTKEEPT
jgi:DNA-binding transcriptional MerR regulator